MVTTILNILIIFVFLNLLSFILYRPVRRWLRKRSPGVIRSHKKDRHTWFGLSVEEYTEYIQETEQIAKSMGNIHEEFVEISPRPYDGKYYNISKNGYREGKDQGPWPIDDSFFNIFFYGGSTAYHIGAGWHSIASRLQEVLSGKYRKNVKVYNFGRPAYFSTQEKILHSQLMQKGTCPDMAIFFHGLNEFYFFDGKPVTYQWFSEVMDNKSREALEAIENTQSAEPKWGLLKQFLQTLPLPMLLNSIIKSSQKSLSSYGPTRLEPEIREQIIDRLLNNQGEIQNISDWYGVQSVFIIQPIPCYRYDLFYHLPYNALENRVFSGHERSGIGYPYLLDAIEKNGYKNRISLAHIQEDMKKNLYVDTVHYTAEFSKTIAEHIANELIARKFFILEKERCEVS